MIKNAAKFGTMVTSRTVIADDGKHFFLLGSCPSIAAVFKFGDISYVTYHGQN